MQLHIAPTGAPTCLTMPCACPLYPTCPLTTGPSHYTGTCLGPYDALPLLTLVSFTHLPDPTYRPMAWPCDYLAFILWVLLAFIPIPRTLYVWVHSPLPYYLHILLPFYLTSHGYRPAWLCLPSMQHAFCLHLAQPASMPVTCLYLLLYLLLHYLAGLFLHTPWFFTFLLSCAGIFVHCACIFTILYTHPYPNPGPAATPFCLHLGPPVLNVSSIPSPLPYCNTCILVWTTFACLVLRALPVHAICAPYYAIRLTC